MDRPARPGDGRGRFPLMACAVAGLAFALLSACSPCGLQPRGMAVFSVTVTRGNGERRQPGPFSRPPFCRGAPRQAVRWSSCRARGSLASLRGRRRAAAGWGQEDEASQSVPRPGGIAAIRFRTLSEITSPIVPTGTTRLRPFRRKLELLRSCVRSWRGGLLAPAELAAVGPHAVQDYR
jgi:hypothetical protein